MLISIKIESKSFGHNILYSGLNFDIREGEKVGLIGRNGTGKSTLFNIISGADTDFQGELIIKRGTMLSISRQEHHGHEHKLVMNYIQGDLPEYAKLAKIIDTYPALAENDPSKLVAFSQAVDRFSQLGYYQIEDEITQAFEAYQLDTNKIHGYISDLSGGQKRMIELIKVQRSRADLALIDEPTNHMDYVAKRTFSKWLSAAKEAVIVITHDRDVLQSVDRIIEIRNGKAYSFRGNYDKYLSVNKNQVSAQVNEYDLIQRRIVNLREDVIRFRRLKERSRDPGTIRRFKSQEQHAKDELELLSKAEKPSFWIDQESVGELSTKMSNAYENYKAKNIKLNSASKSDPKSSKLLVQSSKLSLGYGDIPLFTDLSFSINSGELIRLHGRNGAGKTTLINAITAKAEGTSQESNTFSGNLSVDNNIRLGIYEQEIDSKYIPLKLNDAIEQMLGDKGLKINEQHVKRLLGDYLFNPMTDGNILIERLSGGQKARFQLMRMFANDPELLILDEPTNHLDLPSVEELENTLLSFKGAIIYVSHDSHFNNKFNGEIIDIGK
jgi:ATP-binding cassette subfamily F protein 3